MIVQFLIPSLAADVGDSGRLHTLTRGVIVHILECVLVKVNGRGSESLRGHLRTADLASDTLKTNSNLLRGQQLVNCSTVVSLAQVQLVKMGRLC